MRGALPALLPAAWSAHMRQQPSFFLQMLIPAAEVGRQHPGDWTSLTGLGTEHFMHLKRRALLGLVLGSESRTGKQTACKSQLASRWDAFSSPGHLSSVLLFYNQSASSASQRCEFPSAGPYSIILLLLKYLYMPKYLLCYFMSCAMETHHTRHLEEEFTTNQCTQGTIFPSYHRQPCSWCSDQKPCRTPLPHSLAQQRPQNIPCSLGLT